LEQLGFVPSGISRRIRAVGNTSLAGAALLACEPGRREPLAMFCARARLLPLVDAPDFHHNYIRHMRFGA
ncbi:MAG: ASKHA domain-containing protein, partial [Desulfovibrionaceae bacterium]|nr:ASKHA domain-containing protein [Desulfovibrionaceae bacterium]